MVKSQFHNIIIGDNGTSNKNDGDKDVRESSNALS